MKNNPVDRLIQEIVEKEPDADTLSFSENGTLSLSNTRYGRKIDSTTRINRALSFQAFEYLQKLGAIPYIVTFFQQVKGKQTVKEITDNLMKIWLKNPHLRIGQIIYNAVKNNSADIFNITDKELQKVLKEYSIRLDAERNEKD